MAIFGKKNNEEMPAEQTPAAPEKTASTLDFNRYFLAERRIVLENISYETTKPETGVPGYKLGAKDTVVAQIAGNTGVKVTYNRTLCFEPEGPFVLSVSYAVIIKQCPLLRSAGISCFRR